MSTVDDTMNNAGDVIADALSAKTTDGQARALALQSLQQQAPPTTSVIEYESQGRLVIIGPGKLAAEAAGQLIDEVEAVAIVDCTPDASRPSLDDRIIYLRGEVERVHGHLGDFEVYLQDKGVDPLPLKSLLNKSWTQIDLVLDLNPVPVFDAEISPPGYFVTRGEAQALPGILKSIPYMKGEFEKPRYFNYNPNICVHNRNQKTACTRCIDACPTLAIRSVGEEVQVDPYLCQGGGTCVAVCPSGAMQYVYPSLSDTLNRIRQLLGEYRQQKGEAPWIVFVEQEHTDEVYPYLSALPENLIPVALDELGALDTAIMLNTLAYGAERVFIVTSEQTPPRIRETLRAQRALAESLLEPLGYGQGRLIIGPLAQGDWPLRDAQPVTQATYAAFDDKRTMIRMALEHFCEQSAHQPTEIALGQDAPFGRVHVDTAACTLCLACASVCPTRALLAGNETPQLKFVEDNCVQCGLCEQTCPEDAVRREARYVFDGELRRRQQVLHEEAPFQCVSCGKPFATRRVIEQMQQRLSGHWMFSDERALRRLQMCEDCRVEDMWDQGA